MPVGRIATLAKIRPEASLAMFPNARLYFKKKVRLREPVHANQCIQGVSCSVLHRQSKPVFEVFIQIESASEGLEW